MIKIAAISGLIIAGITILMVLNGPCDPIPESGKNLSEKVGPSGKKFANPVSWINETGCKLRKLPDTGKELNSSSSPSESLKPTDSKDLKQSSNLSAIFKFNSYDVSRATQLKLESVVYKDHPVKKFNPYLPIKIDLASNGSIVWQGTVTANDCHDEEKVPLCEVKGYVNNTEWWKGTLKLRAYDVNSQRIASFDFEILRK